MANTVCVGGETKANESRVTLTPDAVVSLMATTDVAVQNYPNRIWPDHHYTEKGIRVVPSTEDFDIVVATKEYGLMGEWTAPHRGQVRMCFHHAHKGQPHNVERLRLALDLELSCFDYELYRVGGMQPITTSYYAGAAGAVNALWTWGLRHPESALARLPKPGQYGTIEAVKAHIGQLRPFNERVRFLVLGATGVCGQGSMDVLRWLGLREYSATDVLESHPDGPWVCGLSTEDVTARNGGGCYNKDEYRKYGRERYRSSFWQFLGEHDVLIHDAYWDERFPKHLSREQIISSQGHLPEVVSDVTCDIDGSFGCTREETTVGSPVRRYDPETHAMDLDFGQPGMLVTAVDNLPAQIAGSCSEFVSSRLIGGVVMQAVVNMDTHARLDRSGLSPEMQLAFITWRGELTEPYRHLGKLL